MNKKELFKNFARMHPELVSYVKNGKMTWQSFYELYDIYGEDNKAWSPYLNSSSEGLSENITDKLRRISTWLTIRAIEKAQEEDLCVEEKRFVLSVQTKSMM